MGERRLFSNVQDAFDRHLDADSADGLLMESIQRDGWAPAFVRDVCLFVHAPSIQSCAWDGGVWDDRDLIKIAGGRCLTPEEADDALDRDDTIEEVVIDVVSNDGHVEAFEGATQESMEAVRCIRKKNYKEEEVLGLTQVWYSEWCADDQDVDVFKERMDVFYPTPEAEIEAGERAMKIAGVQSRS